MLIAALVTLLLLHFGLHGESAVSDVQVAVETMREFAKDEIHEAERLERILATLDEMSHSQEEFLTAVTSAHIQILMVESQYDAGAEAYRSACKHLEEVWEAAERRMIDLRFRLKDDLTRAEWNAMFEKLSKSLGIELVTTPTSG